MFCRFSLCKATIVYVFLFSFFLCVHVSGLCLLRRNSMHSNLFDVFLSNNAHDDESRTHETAKQREREKRSKTDSMLINHSKHIVSMGSIDKSNKYYKKIYVTKATQKLKTHWRHNTTTANRNHVTAIAFTAESKVKVKWCACGSIAFNSGFDRTILTYSFARLPVRSLIRLQKRVVGEWPCKINWNGEMEVVAQRRINRVSHHLANIFTGLVFVPIHINSFNHRINWTQYDTTFRPRHIVHSSDSNSKSNSVSLKKIINLFFRWILKNTKLPM